MATRRSSAAPYGWASAGRFHHSQSQLHRFLNQLGGYTYSVQSYSTDPVPDGAAQAAALERKLHDHPSKS